MTDRVGCRLCGSRRLTVPGDLSSLKGVTSDCKPWPATGPVVVCPACGLVQKEDSLDWLDAISRVYEAYAIYHQSSGAEQAVFEGATGQGTPRSVRLLQRLAAELDLPARGRLLDVGCGNGVLLRSVSVLAPGWTLAGADLDDRHRASVEAIPNVARFYAGPVEQIDDRFDAIVMQHVLEHVPAPVQLLAHLRRLLEPGGILFVQVPNVADNPFDLMVVDHASHFSPDTARATVLAAGLRLHTLATDWAPKELTAVAAADQGSKSSPVQGRAPADVVHQTAESLRWLLDTAADAASTATTGVPFGLLGTSIAATWLANMLGGLVQFFVDEDVNRVGQEFMGRPVLDACSAAAGSCVYLAFPPTQARTIRARLSAAYPHISWLAPPRRRA